MHVKLIIGVSYSRDGYVILKLGVQRVNPTLQNGAWTTVNKKCTIQFWEMHSADY